ncbi:DEAD/DEAH box helicase [Natronosporangium hydrolyticum]|uniref:DEAD/DEAH box helicase n=1 Tax=Natronosporangium hydrolyticum TaxID=2811111 RepID=A0A895YG58_9ACTN|nr:DEAD/DEAH box helicase [Natronosporangium hydrolyticum]QSB14469.1 DEAD/DEAH box helicase [Natronosporangium hydrolyticum]
MTDTAANQEQAEKQVKPDSPTFADLGARPETVAALAAVGITHSFAIQEYAIPIAMRGNDVIGQAPTGTGKTLGFGVPLLERVTARSEGADGTPQALVVVPTRELCLQVASDLTAGGATRGIRVLPIYGGVAYESQTDKLRAGVEIVVGTPGRLLDLARQKQLKLRQIQALVLDEADRMLDLGFLDDVEKILAMLPAERQTMLFSATMPDPIVALSRRFLRSPMTLHATHPGAAGAGAPQTRQVIYRTHSLNKVEMVARILQARERGLTIIFSRTKRGVDKVAGELDFRGFACAAVHGDLGQGARERALRAFRSGKVDVLVATDVAARGLDVTGVTHVINYDCPEDPDTYTHRIGRTGRAGATGIAVTFVDWEDMARWRLIDKSMGLATPEPPETYHTSEWLAQDLDIPSDATGILPSAQQSRAGLGAETEEDLGGSRTKERGRRRPTDRPAERSPRSPRQRRRRGGTRDAAAVGEPSTTSAPTSAPTAAVASAPEREEPTTSEGGAGRTRRRRRRGGRGAAGREGARPEQVTEATEQPAS